MTKQARDWQVNTLLVTLLLSGCAASGPPFQKVQIPEGKSVIYAYRPSTFFAGGVNPPVSCGGEHVRLGRGAYHPFIVDPGKAVCAASTEATSSVGVECKAGEERYVKEEIDWGFVVSQPRLSLVDNATGESEIQDCGLQEP
jgi:hypothetical protein